jgi:hypothetical protein
LSLSGCSHLPANFIRKDLCSKSAVGFYSPEKKTAAAEDEALDADSSEGSEGSDADEEDDAEPVEATAAKHFEQIISIVNQNAQKRQDKAVRRHQAARAMQAPSNTVPASATAEEPANDQLNDFGESDAPIYDARLHNTAPADNNAEAASSQSSTSSAYAGQTGPAGIRELVLSHIMGVLNTGTYEEVSSLAVRSVTLLFLKQRSCALSSVVDVRSSVANQR